MVSPRDGSRNRMMSCFVLCFQNVKQMLAKEMRRKINVREALCFNQVFCGRSEREERERKKRKER